MPVERSAGCAGRELGVLTGATPRAALALALESPAARRGPGIGGQALDRLEPLA